MANPLRQECGARNLHKFLASKFCGIIGRLCFESFWYQNLHRIERTFLSEKPIISPGWTDNGTYHS